MDSVLAKYVTVACFLRWIRRPVAQLEDIECQVVDYVLTFIFRHFIILGMLLEGRHNPISTM